MHSNWPALLIALLMIAYWARVALLVRQTRKTTRRSANFLPPEPLGRLLRIIWIPVVGLWIILPLLSFFVRHPAPPLEFLLKGWPLAAPLRYSALAVAVAAYVLTRICWRRMGTSWRMGIDPNDATHLIVTGPYAYVRHPIYALSSLLMLMTLIIVPTWPMLAIALLHLVLLQWEARREEQYLIRIHGEKYRDYAARTGRFLPRSFTPYTVTSQ